MDEHEDAIDVDRLDHWQPAIPPSGFADRVAERWARERDAVHRSSPRRRWRIAAWTALFAGMLLVGWAVTRDTDRADANGSLVASSRQSVALGGRATLVAEVGAEIDWRVEPDGRAAIEQRAGRVFYRVEEGAPFEVATPSGTVHVTGTCFTVEVEPMNRRSVVLRGTAVAALSAAVVVAVYEGGVVVAHDGVEVAAAPGERVVSDGERGVRRISADADEAHAHELSSGSPERDREIAELRVRASDDRSEIDRLRARIESLGGKPDDASPRERAQQCANRPLENGCSWVEPDAETLREMARCAAVRLDNPVFLFDAEAPTMPSDEWIADRGLSVAQAKALAEENEQFRRKHDEALLHLYEEAGGDSAEAGDQPPPVLEGMIEALLDKAEMAAARRRLARERAGLSPSDSSALTLADRLVRQVYGAGDEYEKVVAKVVGPERAHELRLIDDGWGASWHRVGDCEDE